MKKAALIALALLCVHIICAQPTIDSIDSIDSLCQRLCTTPNTTGSFTQTKTISSINRSLKSTGNFTLCPEGIVWKTKKPFASTLVIGADFMAQIAADGSETVSDFSDNETFKSVASGFISVFSNDASVLKSNFDIAFKGGDGVWSATLSPKDATIATVMGEIALSGVFDGTLCEMRAVSINEKSGDKILYELTSQSHPDQIPAEDAAAFKRFSPHKR